MRAFELSAGLPLLLSAFGEMFKLGGASTDPAVYSEAIRACVVSHQKEHALEVRARFARDVLYISVERWNTLQLANTAAYTDTYIRGPYTHFTLFVSPSHLAAARGDEEGGSGGDDSVL